MRKQIRFAVLSVLGAGALLAVNYAATSQNDNKFLINVVWSAPATAAVLEGDNQSNLLFMEIEPNANPIAALTINLEPANQLRIGTQIWCSFKTPVTALTVNASATAGGTILNNPTSAASNDTWRFVKFSLGTGSGAVWRKL